MANPSPDLALTLAQALRAVLGALLLGLALGLFGAWTLTLGLGAPRASQPGPATLGPACPATRSVALPRAVPGACWGLASSHLPSPSPNPATLPAVRFTVTICYTLSP